MIGKSMLLENRHWREINPVQCGWQECEPGHAFGPSARTHYLLHYVVSGKGHFTVRNRRYTLGPGQIFVIRPYEITYYEANRTDPWRYIWVGLESGMPLPAALEEDILSLPQAGPLFAAMWECSEREAGRELALCGRIYELLSLLSAGAPSADGAQRYVETAKTFIETEYMRNISIADLARQLNLNRSYFSSIFRQKTGRSPQQFLTDCRLRKAAELMSEHGCTPGEAALSTGYPDIFSFSRMFKRHYGVSPSDYVRQHSQSPEEKPEPLSRRTPSGRKPTEKSSPSPENR